MANLPETRNSLLRRLGAPDHEAWREFVQIYEKAIVDYARGRGLQDADARDVAQEVLATVHNRVESWDDDPQKGRFRGWLFRVTRNISIDRIHERRKQSGPSFEADNARTLEKLESRGDASTAFLREYRRALLEWAAEQVKTCVDPDTWQCFWRTAVEGHPPEQVAADLNSSVGRVYTAKCRVMTRIRQVVAQREHDSDSGLTATIEQSTFKAIFE